MRRNRGGFAAAFALSLALAAPIADAQKSGGVLIISHFDSPASMSLHEGFAPHLPILDQIVEDAHRRPVDRPSPPVYLGPRVRISLPPAASLSQR
jgi:hypothetical protein